VAAPRSTASESDRSYDAFSRIQDGRRLALTCVDVSHLADGLHRLEPEELTAIVGSLSYVGMKPE
jgi:hypothetical protein